FFTCRLLQFTLPNVRTIFILMIVVVAFAMQTCAEKKGFVYTLKDHNERALHINSHGKVSAEDISLAQFFTTDSVGDVMDFMDFRITIYTADVNYFLCFHQGRLVGKRNATKECHFRESMVNGHHQYTYAYNPVLHVGFKRNFRPVGPKDLARPHVMKKATFFFFRLDEESFRNTSSHLRKHTKTNTNTRKTTITTSTTSTTTTTTKPPSTTTPTPTPTPTTTPITTTTTLSPVAGTKRTRSKSRRPTSINSDSIPSESRSQSNSLKSYNQANSNKNDAEGDLQQKIPHRNRKQHRLKKQKQHRQTGRRRTVGLMAQPQPKNLEVRHHHNNATIMERRRRRRLERQQHKLQRELWEREQRQAGEIEREREREEHHLPKAATSSASSSSSSSSSTATSTALTATAASLAPSAFNLVAIVAASRRKRDRRKRSAEVASPPPTTSKSGGASQPPAADMQLVELPSQRQQQQQQPQNTEYSKPYVNSNLNNPLKSSNSINVNHAIPALPKNYNYLYSNEHYNLNTKSSTTDSSSLETSTKFDSPNSHSNSHSHSNSDSDSHSHSAFNQNIDNNLKQLNDRIEEMPEAGEMKTKVKMEMETEMEMMETASEDAVVENRNHIDASNIIDDPNDEEHEELILNKLFRGLQELQQQQQPQQQQQQQQQQPNIDNHNENINVVNNNQNHNDNGLLTNNNHNSNYNEQFANDDETIRIQNNKYETHIVQYKHVVFISKSNNICGGFL
ncbi:hypothetical protein KR200_007432, partial [Drosophila serrata]